MSEIDANILSEGKRVIATKEQEGTLIKVSDTDATCLIQDTNGKKHLAIKIVKVEGDNLSNTDISAQGLTENNELAVAIAEQDGNIIVDNGENDYNCIVETENGKQLAVKTFALEGTPLKTGGDKDATCLIEDENGNKQLALKVFNLGGSSSDWQVGDRLDNKATFVGYFDSVNPDDSSTQRYAFFALDGNYRAAQLGLTEYGVTFNDLLPTHDYNTSLIGQNLNEITESATYSMSVVKNLGINSYPAFKAADNISVSFNGITYTAVVPNLVEVKAIWDNRTAIDSVDPSGVRTLATWGMWDGSSYDRVISTTIRNQQYAFQYNSSGNFAENRFYATYGFVPIIEIPVPAGHGA